MLLSESMFIQSSRFASPLRIAVSLRSNRKVESYLGAAEIKESISCSVGMKGMLSETVHLGGVHVVLFNFRNIV